MLDGKEIDYGVKMIVCKFGGSATAKQQGVRNIKLMAQNDKRKVLVFSAVGRKNPKDIKLTDFLINYTKENNLIKKDKILQKIEQKLQNLVKLLKLSIDISEFITQIKFSNDNKFIVSRGEYITSFLMSKYLNLTFIPPEEIIFFKNGKLNMNKTKKNLLHKIEEHGRFVTGGFYGYDENERKIVLFERGGGDTTGAIIAKLLNAKVYENYTDICGVKPINPKYFLSTQTISKLSYSDMKKLASYDGSVVHKSVCELLNKTSVITKIINIFDYNKGVTTLDSNSHACKFVCFKEADNKIDVLLHGEKEMKLSIKKSP